MPVNDVLELNTEARSGDLSDKLYEREIGLCVEAGADEQQLREGGFNVYQLEQIRQGLNEGLDVNVYMDAKWSWIDMEEIRKGLKQGIDMSRYREQGYSTGQKREIRKGIARGLDVSQYDKKNYLSEQMRQIRFGLMDNLPVMFYKDPAYNAAQMEEIRKGLKSGVDISAYAKTDIPFLKMRAVRTAMEDGLHFDEQTINRFDDPELEQLRRAHRSGVEVRKYADEGYNAPQLEQIRISLENKLDFEPYIRKDMRGESLREIRLGLEEGLDVTVYAKPDYTWKQMEELRLGLENRVDVTRFSNPLFDARQMRQIRLGLEKGLDVSRYNSLVYTASDMRRLRLALLRGEDAGRSLYREPEIPEHYDDPVLPPSQRPDKEALQQAVAKEAAALKARLAAGKDTSGVQKVIEAARQKIRQAQTGESVPPVLPDADRVPAALFGAEETGPETPAAIDMQGHNLVVSEDKMACYISLPRPRTGIVYTPEMIRLLLARSGVHAGIDENVIRDLIEHARYDEQVIVAKGKPAVNGKDGRYEYFFNRQSFTNPEEEEDGTADFSKTRFFSEVKAGDTLAKYVHAERGTNGYLVTGEVLPARNGLERPVLKGSGFMLLPDKVTYAAAVAGVVKMDGYELNIHRLLTLTDDNLEQTLNGKRRIDFVGSLWVRCNLDPGIEINTKGDIIFDTVAESLKITCGGDVVLKEGATGRTRGSIKARGTVAGKYFSNYEIVTDGSVFANSFLHCKVETEEKIVCFGDNGTIYGGELKAKLGLECAVIGTQNGTHTVINIGVTKEMWEELAAKEKAVDRLKSEVETLENEIERISAAHLISKDQLQWKIKISAAHAIKQKAYEEAVAVMEETAERVRSVEGAEAIVSRILYSGTTFIVDESVLQITQTKEAEQGIVIKGRERHWKRKSKS